MEDWRTIGNDKSKYQAYLCSREWSILKREVKRRSGGMCERCRQNPHECTHHLTYERKYAERLEDLQALCNKCHDFIHGKSDIDPSLKPPAIGGKSIRGFYLAGKITGTEWRDEIVPDWSFQNHSSSYDIAVTMNKGFSEWNPIRIRVPKHRGFISYFGPWWCDTESVYGGHASCSLIEGPHASGVTFYEKHGDLVGPDADRFYKGVSRLVQRAILQSDLIFAWIDSENCFGTMAEIGLAVGLGKVVVVAAPEEFGRGDLWLSFELAHINVFAESPAAAWRALWASPDLDRKRGARPSVITADREVQVQK